MIIKKNTFYKYFFLYIIYFLLFTDYKINKGNHHTIYKIKIQQHLLRYRRHHRFGHIHKTEEEE